FGVQIPEFGLEGILASTAPQFTQFPAGEFPAGEFSAGEFLAGKASIERLFPTKEEFVLYSDLLD
ncbi:713_t:CDS:2, partial [Racocetra fulgida]